MEGEREGVRERGERAHTRAQEDVFFVFAKDREVEEEEGLT